MGVVGGVKSLWSEGSKQRGGTALPQQTPVVVTQPTLDLCVGGSNPCLTAVVGGAGKFRLPGV